MQNLTSEEFTVEKQMFFRQIFNHVPTVNTDIYYKQHFIEIYIKYPMYKRSEEKTGIARHSLTKEELVKKEHNKILSKDPKKPGEFYELISAYHQDDPAELLLELADIEYYIISSSSLSHLASVPNNLANFFEIQEEFMLDACIFKYLTRRRFGDLENYHDIESEMMNSYLTDVNPGLRETLTHFLENRPKPESELYNILGLPYNNSIESEGGLDVRC